MWQSKRSESTSLGCEIQFLWHRFLTIAAGACQWPHLFFPPAVAWLPSTATGTKALCSSTVEATKHSQAGIKDLQWSYRTSRHKKGGNCSSRRWDITRRLKPETISCHCRHPALLLVVKLCNCGARKIMWLLLGMWCLWPFASLWAALLWQCGVSLVSVMAPAAEVLRVLTNCWHTQTHNMVHFLPS